MNGDRLGSLIESLLDGSPLPWRDAPPDDPALSALRDLERITSFHRHLQRTPGPAGTRSRLGVLPARDERYLLQPGQRLANRYRVEQRLGRGGMGEVYAAYDEELEIPVALKTLRLGLARRGPALLRLKREVLLARSVAHPNVCRVFDVGRHGEGDDTIGFLTMELLDGVTLQQRLKERGRLTTREALPLVEQVAAGLSAAHRAGVVHRDFKTDNVMLVATPSGERAVITDFGVASGAAAALWDPEATGGAATRMLVGTPAYMAPEQVRGDPAGAPADVYALGVVLFEIVTGRLPFEGGSALESAVRRLVEPPPSPRSLVPDLDPRWDAAISRCLSREPTDRLPGAEELAAALVGSEREREGVRHALPAERDAFVGRTADLVELEGRVAGGDRLVTLLGAAGMGKTRLAVRYGWRSLERWRGGAWFCDLTEARSVEGVATAVATSLGVALAKGDVIAQLGHAIAARGPCLMVLDNFEQVTSHAGATVERWMDLAPDARFVVTSRERLQVRGESVQVVDALDPASGVAMFVDRMRRQRPGVEPRGAEREAVQEVVRLVEGVPLAIELAAARTRVMTPVQIVERMRQRFRLLASGPAGRHAALETAFHGSWELLRPWEMAALAQCSVFQGGFALEAVEAVLDVGAWPDAPWFVDVIQSLVDKSLLQTWTVLGASADAPQLRFGMLTSLQEFAGAMLAEPTAIPLGESGPDAVRGAEERHGRWYARFGRDEALAPPGPRGPCSTVALEIDNLVAACRRAAARRDGRTAVDAYSAIWSVLDLQGPFGVAVELGTVILDLPLDPSDRAQVLTTLGNAESGSGRRKQAEAHYEAALELYRSHGDRRGEAVALTRLGVMRRELGRMQEARRHGEAALPIHREVRNRRFEALTLDHLGVVDLEEGRMEEGRSRLEAALGAYREVGDRRGESVVLGHLGALDVQQGRLGDAKPRLEAALAIHRELRDRRYEGVVQGNLGILNHLQGRPEEARSSFEAAIAIHREVGSRRSEAIALANLSSLTTAQGRWDEAWDQCQAALAAFREMGERRWEGNMLGNLGNILLQRGRLDESTSAFAKGEEALRSVGAPLELAKLLCDRGQLERRKGNRDAARAILSEAEGLARQVGAGPDSELARQVAELREALGPAAPASPAPPGGAR